MKYLNLLFMLCVSAVCFSQGKPSGVIISHFQKDGGKFIGSPSICILPNGDYVASHDEFGSGSSEFRSAVSHIFSSSDKGETWKEISVIRGLFWSNLFVHNKALYNIGTNKHHGNVVIRKSTDGGVTWTNPYNATNGLLLEGE
jgi:Neuraminidase (sialidase)